MPRRLGKVRVVNIAEPVEMHELPAQGRAAWAELRADYERALEEFEKKNFGQAAGILGSLVPRHPHDGPSLVLLSRAVGSLVDEPVPFDPVWELPGK